MKSIVYSCLVMALLFGGAGPKGYDFDGGSPAGWGILGDDVMGGISEGKVSYKNGVLVFSGNISLENNGGFSWAKSPVEAFDFTGFKGVEVRIKADGRKYAFTIETPRTNYVSYFRYDLDTTPGEWVTLRVPFNEMRYTFFGRTGNQTLRDPETIRRLGFILSDKKSGAFTAEIDYIKGY